jgi:hypothetical protein
MEADFREASRALRSRMQALSKRQDWHLGDVGAHVAAGTSGVSVRPADPITNLLAVLTAQSRDERPWIPYWRLEELGGRLDWACPIDNPSNAPEAAPEAALHTWLYPGDAGWGIPTAFRVPLAPGAEDDD